MRLLHLRGSMLLFPLVSLGCMTRTSTTGEVRVGMDYDDAHAILSEHAAVLERFDASDVTPDGESNKTYQLKGKDALWLFVRAKDGRIVQLWYFPDVTLPKGSREEISIKRVKLRRDGSVTDIVRADQR